MHMYSHVHTVYSESELDLYMVCHTCIYTDSSGHTHTHSLRVVTRDTLRFIPLQETVLDYLHC